MKFDLSHWLMALVAMLGGGTGLWGWMAARSKGKVDLVAVAQEAAKGVIGDLREEVERHREDGEALRERVSGLEEQLAQLRHEHQALMAANASLQTANDQLQRENQRLVGERDAAEARILQLEGELRQKQQVIESLETVHGKAGE